MGVRYIKKNKKKLSIIFWDFIDKDIHSSLFTFSMRMPYTERKQRRLRWLISGVLSKMAEDVNSGRRIADKIMLLLFYLCTKKYSRSSVKLQLKPGPD